MSESVLLINRDELVGDAVEQGLERKGVSCEKASDMRNAVRSILSDPPKAVIVHLEDDNESSLSLCEKLRKDERTRSIPILAISDTSKLGFTEEILKHGIDDYVCRPFRLGKLLRKVDRLLQHGPSQSMVDVQAIPDSLADKMRSVHGKMKVLSDVADIHHGVCPRANRFRSPHDRGRGWMPVLKPEAVHAFALTAEREYVRFDRIGLQRVPEPDEFRIEEKVVIGRRTDPLVASVDRNGFPVGTGMYAILPLPGISCTYLTAILNSRIVNFYANRWLTSNSRSDSFLRKDTLAALPIPMPSGRKQKALCRMADELGAIGPFPFVDSARLRKARIFGDLNRAVFDLFGLDSNDCDMLASLHY